MKTQVTYTLKDTNHTLSEVFDDKKEAKTYAENIRNLYGDLAQVTIEKAPKPVKVAGKRGRPKKTPVEAVEQEKVVA